MIRIAALGSRSPLTFLVGLLFAALFSACGIQEPTSTLNDSVTSQPQPAYAKFVRTYRPWERKEFVGLVAGQLAEDVLGRAGMHHGGYIQFFDERGNSVQHSFRINGQRVTTDYQGRYYVGHIYKMDPSSQSYALSTMDYYRSVGRTDPSKFRTDPAQRVSVSRAEYLARTANFMLRQWEYSWRPRWTMLSREPYKGNCQWFMDLLVDVGL